jgi:hypothetical protein
MNAHKGHELLRKISIERNRASCDEKVPQRARRACRLAAR